MHDQTPALTCRATSHSAVADTLQICSKNKAQQSNMLQLMQLADAIPSSSRKTVWLEVDMLAVLQEEKSQLEGVLAEVQARLDARDMQLQDAVHQLNISKFMLSDSDHARSQVGTLEFTPVLLSFQSHLTMQSFGWNDCWPPMPNAEVFSVLQNLLQLLTVTMGGVRMRTVLFCASCGRRLLLSCCEMHLCKWAALSRPCSFA